ncbi:MAG: hydroxyacid dehydrogenase [Betaproteobacteria bacterium]|nr:MAG: hydroxyacid dehydrogenase [Betaproteobacteria bacterium]
MTGPRLRVFRLDIWQNPAFAERLGREAGIELITAKLADPEASSLEALGGAHVYSVSSAKDDLPQPWFVTAALLARCPRLVCVSTYGAGYDTVDVAACTRAGVLVVNQAGANAQAVAEHAFGFILGLAHRIGESDRRLRRERGFTREAVMGHQITGKVLGLVGLGNTGTRTARIARIFDMTVLATDPFLTPEEIGRRGATGVPLEELLTRSDFVSLHCPRDASTLGLMDAAAFARMKTGAIFVTTARGGIHDEAALCAALQTGHLAGAGLDVWDIEPPPLDHPLLKLDNVIATFHTAGVKHEARWNTASWGAEQIAAIAKGLRPPRIVNPEVWPEYVRRFEAITGTKVRSGAAEPD